MLEILHEFIQEEPIINHSFVILILYIPLFTGRLGSFYDGIIERITADVYNHSEIFFMHSFLCFQSF